MGFDEPALRALAMLRQAGIVLAVCALGLLAEFLARRAELASRAGIAICVFVVAVLVAEVEPGAWLAVGGGLPVLTLLALGGFAWLVLHRRERWPLVLLAWSVWALALLAKMPLNARIYSYGFALAMPAGVLLVAVLLGVVPRLAPRAWGGLPVYRGAIAGVVIAACIGFLRVTDLHNRHKTFAFGRGADTILTYGPGPPTNLPYGVGLQRALELVEALPEGSTVAAVPMGAMLNYQARRPSSSSFGQFTPFSQHVSGTDAVERSLLESPPDYVVLVHAHLPGFGMGFFGRDPRNAGRVWQWLQTDYVLREQIFDPPFREVGKFGIQLLERRKDGS